MVSHLHQSGNRFPTYEHRDDGRNDLRRQLQVSWLDDKEGDRTTDDQERELRIGASQLIGGALGQATPD